MGLTGSYETPRMDMESAAASAWSPFCYTFTTVAAVAVPLLLRLLLLRLGAWARLLRRKPLNKRTAPRQERDVFRRRASESPPRSADLNKRQGPHGLFPSIPAFNTAITDETHRRLMSEVEAGTANSAARYYADMVRRNEEHARRTGGFCPSPLRCTRHPVDDL